MTPLLLALNLVALGPVEVVEVRGDDVRVRAVQSKGTVQVFFDLGARGRGFSAVAATPLVQPKICEDFGFRTAQSRGLDVLLFGDRVECVITVPRSGTAVVVEMKDARKGKGKSSLFALNLLKSGKPAKATDHFFPSLDGWGIAPLERLLTPISLAATDVSGFAIIPDVSSFSAGTTINPVMYGDFGDQAVLAYGFVPFSRMDDGRVRPMGGGLNYEGELVSRFYVVLSRADDLMRKALEQIKIATGEERWGQPFPQMVPFEHYLRLAYSLSEGGPDQPDSFHQFEFEGMPVGAPYDPERLARLDADQNLARFAWGMRWWGTKLGQPSWVARADAAMNLAITAPITKTGTGHSFDLDKKAWNVNPFRDLSLAQTGRFVLRYITDFPDYPNSEKAVTFLDAAAGYLVHQSVQGVSVAFFQEYVASHVISEGRRAQITSILTSNGWAMARQRFFAYPDVEFTTYLLSVSRTREKSAQKHARDGMDKIFLSQAAWHPWTVGGVDVFGSIVGKKMVSHEQATYAADLFDAAIQLGDKDSAERALRAIRAPLSIIKHPVLGQFQARLPEGGYLPQSHGWFDSDGHDRFGPEVGLASGVGQTMATFAHLLKNYGSVYTHKDGWTVCIDGLRQDSDGKIMSAFSTNPLTFAGSFDYTVVDARSGTRKRFGQPEDFPAIRELTLSVYQGQVYVMAIPGFTSSKPGQAPEGSFYFSDGTHSLGERLPTGFGAKVDIRTLLAGPVRFSGRASNYSLNIGPKHLLAGPPDTRAVWPRGWKRLDGLADSFDKALLEGKTKDLTTGAPTATGAIESAPFLLDNTGIAFTLLGTPTVGVYVELCDAGSRTEILTARKIGPEDLDLQWNIELHRGKMVVLRLVDTSKEGWVGIRNPRSADVKALP